MSDYLTRSPAQPAVVLGLTFLTIGLTFALPFRLVPSAEQYAVMGPMSAETANVYACVAWAGWAHFLFAFRGQSNALVHIRDAFRNGRLIAYMACVVFTIIGLLGIRWAGGPTIFGSVVWVYFIDHFIKAEQSFEGKSRAHTPILMRWLSSYQPILTFSWLSAVLMNFADINSYPWTAWSISFALAVIVLALGGWRNLVAGDIRSPLISLFFIGEALVWGAFSRYGGTMFLTGVYVFHIAAGSYFHYFGSYFVANARTRSRDKLLTPQSIVVVNFAFITFGYLVAHESSLRWLNMIFGIQWFALWVALHLVSSDLFPFIKSWKQSNPAAR